MSAVRLTVSGTVEGDVSIDWSFDGSVLAPDYVEEPDLTMTMVNKDYERLVSGDLTPPVAYMQGLLKSTGDTGILLDILESGQLTDALS